MNATVKRKFNALLQGIGSRPSPAVSEHGADMDDSMADPASSPASQRSSPHPSLRIVNDELLHKKRRVGGPMSTPTKYGTSSSVQSSPASIRPTTTISNVTLRKWTPGSASPGGRAADGQGGELPPPPKYCPGDREQLLRRLATFQELTDWTPKPDRVNEIEWAKRGWVCQGKERVKCTLCGRELVVRVNRKEVDGAEVPVLIASEIAQSVVDKYAELVIESHAEDCLWRKKGCDDTLLRLPLPNPKIALQTLRQRYDELCERRPFLPYEFNIRLPPNLNLDTVISHLPSTFFTDPPPNDNSNNRTTNDSNDSNTTTNKNPNNPATPTSTKINRPALALALLGWQSLTNTRLGGAPVPNSASCHTCLRRLGLWMFRSREVDPETQTVLVPAPMDHLDPVREHRFFCPWRNPAAQRNPGRTRPLAPGEEDKPAWEVLVTVLRNEAFIRDKVNAGVGGGGGGKGKGFAAGAGLGFGHGRSKSAAVPAGAGAGASAVGGGGGGDGGGVGTGDGELLPPKTPDRRPITAGGWSAAGVDGIEGGEMQQKDDEADEEARKKKDQDMMSRLRRVKSLFNTKAGNKLRRLSKPGSRPGTSHSAAGEGE